MYNLFISGRDEAFEGKPWEMDSSRCMREYTDAAIVKCYGNLNDTTVVSKLRRFPCIFGYEIPTKKPPKFGAIRDVVQRQDRVRVEYEIQNIEPFLMAEDLKTLAVKLDIRTKSGELNRTHWALKDVKLAKELSRKGITLPDWARQSDFSVVNIDKHRFQVALSFPGENREFVKAVAAELEGRLGPNSCFYDVNYRAQLARPESDTLLQDIYRNRSELIVVFIGSNYQKKDWCGVEWRAIREVITSRHNEKVMFVKMDDGEVEGNLKTDGYMDARKDPRTGARKSSPSKIAGGIVTRVESLTQLDDA